MDTAAQQAAGTAITYGGWSLAQLVLIGVIALIVIFGIVTGMRNKRRRLAAERELAARREAAGQASPPSSPAEPPAPPPLADEPIAAAAPLEASPAALAAEAPEPKPERTTSEEDLALLKGVGPKLVAQLGDLGITRISQIAALTPAEAEALDAQLGAFKGRMARDRWIDQARYLAAGDRAGFEAEFGKL